MKTTHIFIITGLSILAIAGLVYALRAPTVPTTTPLTQDEKTLRTVEFDKSLLNENV